MRDAGPEREDLESTRLPTGDPTPPSDPLQSAPTLAHQLDLTPSPQRGISFDARLEKPPKYGGKRDRDTCKVWLNRMKMHLLSEQVLGGVTYGVKARRLYWHPASWRRKLSIGMSYTSFKLSTRNRLDTSVPSKIGQLYFNVDSRTYGRRRPVGMNGIR